MRASAKTVGNVSLVGKVGLEDVCRVGLDAVEEVIVGRVEQFRNGRHVTAAVAKPLYVLAVVACMQDVHSPHTLQRLVPDNTYSVYVVAVNQFGVSDPSAIISFQLLTPGI